MQNSLNCRRMRLNMRNQIYLLRRIGAVIFGMVTVALPERNKLSQEQLKSSRWKLWSRQKTTLLRWANLLLLRASMSWMFGKAGRRKILRYRWSHWTCILCPYTTCVSIWRGWKVTYGNACVIGKRWTCYFATIGDHFSELGQPKYAKLFHSKSEESSERARVSMMPYLNRTSIAKIFGWKPINKNSTYMGWSSSLLTGLILLSKDGTVIYSHWTKAPNSFTGKSALKIFRHNESVNVWVGVSPARIRRSGYCLFWFDEGAC